MRDSLFACHPRPIWIASMFTALQHIYGLGIKPLKCIKWLLHHPTLGGNNPSRDYDERNNIQTRQWARKRAKALIYVCWIRQQHDAPSSLIHQLSDHSPYLSPNRQSMRASSARHPPLVQEATDTNRLGHGSVGTN